MIPGEVFKNRIKEITADMEKTDGATEQSLAKLKAHFGVELPAVYIEFMRATNGADGPIGNIEYLQIWPAEEIIELDLLRVDMKEEYPEWLLLNTIRREASQPLLRQELTTQSSFENERVGHRL